jgi:formylglycine-generating enzyme required for sulfatase activity
MARIDKTVFISYRRSDVYTALAVYQDLKNHGYDVFFDYRSISSGDFEQIITSNIRARAHFLLILTPTALDRINEPGDWLRREIETAIDEKRNIVPLFFRGFRFGASPKSGMSRLLRLEKPEVLTGKLRDLSRYNGLNVHEDYFEEAMHRLRNEFLNKPLDTVLHPVSNTVQRIVKEEKIAADKALEQIEDVKELVGRVEEQVEELGPESAGPASSNFLKVQDDRREKIIEKPDSAPPGKYPFTPSIAKGERRDLELKKLAPKFSPRIILGGALLAIIGLAVILFPVLRNRFAPGIGSTMISDKDGMTLLYVPAGEFTMGNDNDSEDEKPVHTVTLDAFWIDQTEVTNAMYAKCVDANQCNPPVDTSSYSRSEYFGNPEFDNYPVIYVSWNDAKAYCEWADRRLPTETEWEKAASWNDATREKYTYPWGNDPPTNDLLNYRHEVGDTTEVGAYPQGTGPYGALDMAGNVWEWVSSFYRPYPYDANDGREILDSSIEARVLRGGSWTYADINVRSADRFSDDPASTHNGTGFRCAMSATP